MDYIIVKCSGCKNEEHNPQGNVVTHENSGFTYMADTDGTVIILCNNCGTSVKIY
jgi:hypothetical protein